MKTIHHSQGHWILPRGGSALANAGDCLFRMSGAGANDKSIAVKAEFVLQQQQAGSTIFKVTVSNRVTLVADHHGSASHGPVGDSPASEEAVEGVGEGEGLPTCLEQHPAPVAGCLHPPGIHACSTARASSVINTTHMQSSNNRSSSLITALVRQPNDAIASITR